ncbi:hypothetical protein BDQ17DRAFT_1045384 [Cyathus striatus]|nr:hypothetical protein BDQ17DRAFT_1045384 [Cyathus striatus]
MREKEESLLEGMRKKMTDKDTDSVDIKNTTGASTPVSLETMEVRMNEEKTKQVDRFSAALPSGYTVEEYKRVWEQKDKLATQTANELGMVVSGESNKEIDLSNVITEEMRLKESESKVEAWLEQVSDSEDEGEVTRLHTPMDQFTNHTELQMSQPRTPTSSMKVCNSEHV